jgi:hypothetical protein
MAEDTQSSDEARAALGERVRKATDTQERTSVSLQRITDEFPELRAVHGLEQNIELAKKMNAKLALINSDHDAQQTLGDLLEAYQRGQRGVEIQDQMKKVKQQLEKLQLARKQRQADEAMTLVLENLMRAYVDEQDETVVNPAMPKSGPVS